MDNDYLNHVGASLIQILQKSMLFFQYIDIVDNSLCRERSLNKKPSTLQGSYFVDSQRKIDDEINKLYSDPYKFRNDMLLANIEKIRESINDQLNILDKFEKAYQEVNGKPDKKEISDKVEEVKRYKHFN